MADDNQNQDIQITAGAGATQSGAAQNQQASASGQQQAAAAQTGAKATQPKAAGANAFALEGEEDLLSGTEQKPKYTIPDMVKEKFPDLPQLIQETESMNDEERDYWFQILPIMTEQQISKFRDILLNEKAQLEKLDKEYENKLDKLNEKHMIEWKEFESKEKRKALAGAESKAEAEEKTTEEELLSKLASL